MAWQPLGRNGRSLTADGSAVTTDADGLGDKPKLHKRPVIDSLCDAPAFCGSRVEGCATVGSKLPISSTERRVLSALAHAMIALPARPKPRG